MHIDRLEEPRIREAVQRAESRTAGEIVPVLVPRSGDYEVVTWRGAAAGSLLVLAAVLLVLQFYDGWGLGWLYTPWGVVLTALGGGTAGALLATYVPRTQRLLAGADLLDETVHRRALQSFVEEEVFDTRDRTGILLFVSLREHRIEVLGDSGINQQVDPDDWAEIVARIRKGIRKDNLTEGLVEAIEMCGHLLERRGVNIRPDDENELADQVRTPEAQREEPPDPEASPDA
ncbi:MAG: TPM domain-containing protein [Salinibacter sp.]